MRFQWQASRTPDNLALVTDSETFTYRQLDTMARTIDRGLLANSLDANRPIIIFLPPGKELFAAILGAAMAGTIFFLLDTQAPPDFLCKVAAASNASAILTDSALSDQLTDVVRSGLTTLNVENISDRSEHAILRKNQETNSPVLILYTSGSTGRPKGVLCSNGSLLHRVDVAAHLAILRSSDRIGLLRPVGTASGIHTVLLPLLNGACLHPFDLKTNGFHGLSDWLADRKITGLHIQSALTRTWLSELPESIKLPMR